MCLITGFYRIGCCFSQQDNARLGLDKLFNRQFYFLAVPKIVNLVCIYFENNNKISSEMSDKRCFNYCNVFFLICDTRSGILNSIVRQHFRQSKQIVFMRMLVEVLIGKFLSALYPQLVQKCNKYVLSVFHVLFDNQN